MWTKQSFIKPLAFCREERKENITLVTLMIRKQFES